MKEFPYRINVENKDNFSQLFYNRYICYLRRDIFEHMIKEDENTYFELDTWCRKNLKNKVDMMQKMTEKLIEELEDKGWKCKTSFGGTGLFIYSSDDPPPSCFPDDF